MARRSPLTLEGRRRLRGPRRTVSPRGLPKISDLKPVVPYVTADNEILNLEESRVAWALVDLDIPFIAQARIGPQRALGSGLVDFLLPDHRVALEYQGFAHRTVSGELRDFWRRVTREYEGYRFEEVSYHDLPHIHQVLLRKIGTL